MTRIVVGLLTWALALPAVAAPATELEAGKRRLVEDLAGLRFERLGHPVLRWDHIPPVYAPKDRPHALLVVLVQFPDRPFDRYAGDAAQGEKLAAYYQDLLFDPSYAKPDTLSHYYRTQSLGAYHLQGRVLPPVTLSKPLRAYGGPYRPAGGDWRNDQNAEGLVEEVLAAAAEAHPTLEWEALDRWDPTDWDGDGLRGEPDGYLDHLVLVFAGGGQSSCQGQYKIDDVLNPNTGEAALDTLSAEARACADRLWPHRFVIQKREGQGPVLEGRTHARGGVEVRPGLWSLDYNMQSEYTEASTFVHEFGHSLGLPDVYARTSSNGTGGWEVMSGTADPSPQNLSAWSRVMLGWLRPQVFVPPAFGGRKVQSVYLRTLDDPVDAPAVARAKRAAGLHRAAMVVLPPKVRELELTTLPKASGKQALYSGQGNELNRAAELRLDLRAAKGKVTLSFDAWWSIEAGWDFAYLESSTDDGRTWTRRRTVDPRHMPAKHGHDGPDTVPGLTGLSGDLDGDGKNESRTGCDPKKTLAHGEDKAKAAANPCLEASWVRVAFDLSDLAGQQARVRLRYFTDMAAVLPGILIDNVEISGLAKPWREDFEGTLDPAWRLDGFNPSAGAHTLLVPHFYLFEYRDPYAEGGGHRYDRALADPSYRFFYNRATGRMGAMEVRTRPGVVAWYADGAFAWSENDPVEHGQGRGFLLALDSHPAELAIPGVEDLLEGDAPYDQGYATQSEAAQAALAEAAKKTICFVRSKAWRPTDVPIDCPSEDAPLAKLTMNGKPFEYSYQVINERLPGEARDAVEAAGELFDYKVRGPKLTWRLRDRSLRYVHTQDAPFALEPFPEGVRIFDVRDGALHLVETRPHPAVDRFGDDAPGRWANPKLFFGGVAVPNAGLAFRLAHPKPDAPAGARVKLWLEWSR